MTDKEFKTIQPGDVVKNTINHSVMVVLTDGNPRDSTVQIQMHELEIRFPQFEIVTQKKCGI